MIALKILATSGIQKLNLYYIAAGETMRSGILPKIFAYTGSVSIDRTWRSAEREC